MFQPKYHITNKILNNISKIEAAREVIQNAPLVPAWEAKFREEAAMRTIYHGTHVEGSDLNFSETKAILEGKEISARGRDIQEVLNYREVLKFINTQAGNGKEISENNIYSIHRLVVNEVIPKDQSGSYRLVNVVISRDNTSEIAHRAPLPTLIPQQMYDFLTWLNGPLGQEENPILKAGITHYELVRIHPFVEGNGRTARAVATLVLFLEDYDFKKFFSIEEFYDRNIKDYYDALATAATGDLTRWLEYFTDGLTIELSRVKEKVLKLSVDLKLKGKVGQLALNERQLKLVEYMEDYGKIRNVDWRNLFPMVSDDTILRDLKYLMGKGLIRKTGSTKSAQYSIK